MKEYNISCGGQQIIDLQTDSIDNFYINVLNDERCAGEGDVSIQNIPLGAWIGFVVREFNDSLRYGDEVEIANNLILLYGGKKQNNTLWYRRYVDTANEATVNIVVDFGEQLTDQQLDADRFYKYRIEVLGEY